MGIMSCYVIDCHAARKAFKRVQSSTASGDATRISTACKKVQRKSARGGRNKLRLSSYQKAWSLLNKAESLIPGCQNAWSLLGDRVNSFGYILYRFRTRR